jgi:anti-anti-sigma regulatory factor
MTFLAAGPANGQNRTAAKEVVVDGFRLINVRLDGDTLHAILPYPRMLGQDYREELGQDFSRLCELRAAVVRLDLSAVDYIDGFFPGLVIRLARSLAAAGRQLTVEASPNLEPVFRLTKLDRMFEVVSGAGKTGQASSAEPGTT